MRKILGCVRKAIKDYHMIAEGDKIAVGLSGGKDSIALMTALKLYQRFSPEHYELTAVMIDGGFKGTNSEEVEALKEYCRNLDVQLIIEKTDIASIVFDIRKESNPCSLCAKLRRGALNTKCRQIGANKLALAHNSEDVLETFLLSFIYEGRLSTFQPVSYMSRSGITLIRPLIYASESDIKGAAKRLNFPIVNNPCPMNHFSQREYMKNLIHSIKKDIPFAKDRMFEAIVNAERYNLFPQKYCSHPTENDESI
jgi:tRNA(Ile)-lysidine synthetase-like protein